MILLQPYLVPNRGGEGDDCRLSVSLQTSTVSPVPSYETYHFDFLPPNLGEQSSVISVESYYHGLGLPTGSLQLLTARLMNRLTIAKPWTHDLTNASNRPPQL